MQQLDAGALGSAILAGVGVGFWSSIPQGASVTVHEKRVYEEATPATRGLYDDLYGLYRQSYSSLLEVFDTSSRLRAHSSS